jgi:hypothetical protein
MKQGTFARNCRGKGRMQVIYKVGIMDFLVSVENVGTVGGKGRREEEGKEKKGERKEEKKKKLGEKKESETKEA